MLCFRQLQANRLSCARCIQTKKRLLFISCRMLFQDPIAVNKGQQVSGKLEFVVNEKFSYHITMTAGIDGTAVKTSNKINLHDQVMDRNIFCFICHQMPIMLLSISFVIIAYIVPGRLLIHHVQFLSLDSICLRSSISVLLLQSFFLSLLITSPHFHQQMYHYLNSSAASISYPPTAASRQCNPDTDY